jgi:hypothetical protein
VCIYNVVNLLKCVNIYATGHGHTQVRANGHASANIRAQ